MLLASSAKRNARVFEALGLEPRPRAAKSEGFGSPDTEACAVTDKTAPLKWRAGLHSAHCITKRDKSHRKILRKALEFDQKYIIS